jgi:hypothetical protein
LQFEKADWLIQKLNCNKEDCSCERKWNHYGSEHNFSRSFALFKLPRHKYITNAAVYQLWNTHSKKLIKKIMSDSLGMNAFCFELSDTMLSWGLWRASDLSVFDLETYHTYQIKLPHYGAYAPSDSTCGVFYIFDQGVLVGDTIKNVKKVICDLNGSGNYTVEHEIDISYFTSEPPGIKLIQTDNPERFVLIDNKDAYCYDTLNGTISRMSFDFKFDSAHGHFNSSLILFYTKKRDTVPACIRIFSTENLTEPLHIVNFGNNDYGYYSRFHMLITNHFLFFNFFTCWLFSQQDNSLKIIGEYDVCFEVPKNDKIAFVCDSANLYTITDVFAKQIEEIKSNQIKTVDQESLQPVYTQSVALPYRMSHHSCVIQ